MKTIRLLLLFVPTICFADPLYFKVQPEIQAGIGLHFPSKKTEAFVRPNLVVKEYIFTLAEDNFTAWLVGTKILGVGAQVDTSGQLGVIVSPACVYLLNSCLGPDVIFTKINQVNFGLSWTLRFF